MTNLLSSLPAALPDELAETLVQAKHVRIERIVSHGHTSPEGIWYDQDQHEWVVVLKAAARLRFEDETVEMPPGDFMNIPAHKKHSPVSHLFAIRPLHFLVHRIRQFVFLRKIEPDVVIRGDLLECNAH